MQRQFTSGSRQAPDPFDQFLEENNFYRKHTARDASCLFRVISEQMYDTQLHHLAIRKKCVRYMRKHREFFAPLIDRDLDEYLDDMSKPKTYGTLIELQAVGYMFQRNVLLFEPFNLGNYYNPRSYFNNVFRVFYTPERHFDSVFTCDYIKDAAICQAICYEILYKDLYKLPDVSYAVEHMLHSPTLESTACTTETTEDGYCTRINLADGRSFNFDMPHETNCILENYKLCHFHYSNFPRFSDELQREIKIHSNHDERDKNSLCRTAESLLPHKYISCVRQLLQEGITPFPYKVAKALDPNMYRNIEFDAWNEQRKELKLQNWYNGDANFKVGAKCHVKLCKSENDLYTCHIQEIAVDKGYCIVFIEQLGEKRLVPYDSLTPLPPDQFKPWTLPYRFQRHMQKYSSVRFTRHYNYRFKLNGQFDSGHDYCAPISGNMKGPDYVGMDAEKDGKQHYTAAAAAAAAHHRNGCYYKLKQYTHFENFRAHTVEYCTMPLTVEHSARDLDSKSVTGNSHPPSNDCSRAASRSSTAMGGIAETRMKVEPGVGSRNGGVEDVVTNFDSAEQPSIGGPALILPDFHCFYPVPQYGAMPEDYYAYGYDGALHPPTTALVQAGYYMCPPGAPPAYAPTPNNLYMQTGPPMPPSHPLLTAAAPHAVSNGGMYYPNSALVGSIPETGTSVNNSTGSYVNTPTTRNRNIVGRINWDAKKSVDVNGMDLPTDIATLRHFYNLGLDYHHLRIKRNSEDAAITSGKELNANNIKNAIELGQNAKCDDNSKESKSDSNNNNLTNLNSNANATAASAGNTQNGLNSTGSAHGQYLGNNGGNKSNNLHRRFPSRYFNSNKERQGYSRNQGGNSSSLTNGSGMSNRSQYDCKNTNCGKNGNLQNMSGMHTTRNNMGGGSNGGTTSLAVSVAEQGMPSPSVGYENMNSNSATNAPDVRQTPPTNYNAHQNAFVSYGGSYNDYGVDPNVPAVSLGHTIPSAAGNFYLHMAAPTPYGIYATAPPLPPQPTMGMHAAAAVAGGTFPAPPPPPPHYLSTLPPPPAAVAANMTLQGPPPNGMSATTMANGFYAAPPPDLVENGLNGEGVQFQCVPYPGAPPPMPFYYSPSAAAAAVAAMGGITMNGGQAMPQVAHSGGGGGGGGGVGSGSGSANAVIAANGNCSGGSVGVGTPAHPTGAQGYWCGPPNALLPLPTSMAQSSIGNSTTMTSGSAGGCVGLTTTSANSTTNVGSAANANNRTRDNKQSQ